ncbi:MAG: tyrosine-type recombinase/integrase [Thermoplasmata archaeon]|nr:tyrosine-type recombinase/integrase [Thermoplasmata archaeon]
MASAIVPRTRAARTRPVGAALTGEARPFSVAPVVDRFTRLLQSQERSPCTVKQYGHIARMFLGYVQKPLENVAPQDLNAFREHLVLERHYSKNSLYTTVRGLTCLFRSFGLTTAEQLEAPRRPARLPHYLTEEETHRLFEAVQGNPRDSAIIHVLAYCGLRVGELCRLSVEDVDLSSNILHVRSGKGDRDREVIIEEKTRIAIDRYTAERALAGQAGPRLFPVSPVTVERMVRAKAEVAQINRRVTPHMLRHTLATTLLSRGCDIRYIQKLLGHASVATTQIYTHVDTAALRDAYRRAKPNY